MIKKLLATLTLTALISMPVHAANYKLDPAHSFVEFKIQHLGYSWLYGRFNDIKGTLVYDADKPNDSSITVEVGASSVDTNHAERDKHLRSADFLDVSNFVTATFVSTSFSASETGGSLTGDLTVHGVTNSVTFDVEKVGEGKDPWGGYRVGFTGILNLARADYGVDYNLGPASTSMELQLNIEAIREK